MDGGETGIAMSEHDAKSRNQILTQSHSHPIANHEQTHSTATASFKGVRI